jgi:hypothetical protein
MRTGNLSGHLTLFTGRDAVGLTVALGRSVRLLPSGDHDVCATGGPFPALEVPSPWQPRSGCNGARNSSKLSPADGLRHRACRTS